MSTKPIFLNVLDVKAVSTRALSEDFSECFRENNRIISRGKDQFVLLSVNLQRAMGLFDFSSRALVANPTLAAGMCDKITCDTVCDSICGGIGDGCDKIYCGSVCDTVCSTVCDAIIGCNAIKDVQ